MDTTPLVIDEINAGAEFLKRLNAYQPVKGACWLRASEDEERYLYVALAGLTVANSDIGYAEVLRVTQEMKDHYVDPFRVKLIGDANPIAKALLEIYQRFPGRTPTRFNEGTFARMSVVELYIYPQLSGKA